MASALTKSGEKKRTYTPSRVTKKFWENFEGDEMGVLAAFVRAFQKITFTYRKTETKDNRQVVVVTHEPAPYYVLAMSGAKRPWTPLERLQLALSELTDKKFKFRVGLFDKAQNIVTSNAALPDDTVRKSKVFYDAIMAWDEKALDDCVAQYGKVLEKMGYKPVDEDDFAPLTMDGDTSAKSILDLVQENPVTAKNAETLKNAMTALIPKEGVTKEDLMRTMFEADPNLNQNSFNTTWNNLLRSRTYVFDKKSNIISPAK